MVMFHRNLQTVRAGLHL